MLATIFGYDPKPWEQHQKAVAVIRKSIEKTNRCRTGSLSAQRAPYNSPSDIPNLNKILQIDLDVSTVWAEPNVKMETLVRATIAYGLVPAVVAASKSITVADAFAATTTESSSFKFGTFDCAVLSLETVLSDGQYVMATSSDSCTSDLLCGSAGAMHSLGLTTLLEIALVSASEYVEITCWPVSSISGAMHKMQQVGETLSVREISVVDSATDFVESIMFDSSSGVVLTGRFTPIADFAFVSISTEGQSFLQRIRSVWQGSLHGWERCAVIVHIIDYLFRHDDSRATDRAHKKRRSCSRKGSSGLPDPAQARVLQDIGLPFETVEEHMHSFHGSQGIWPVCIYPVKPPYAFGRRSFGIGAAFEHVFFNLRFYSSHTACSGIMERSLRDMHGFRYLQCRAPCSEVTAWVFHDDRWYGELRSRWKAQGFPDIGSRLGSPQPLTYV